MITRIVLAFLVIFAPAIVQADVTSVTPSPSSVAVSVVGTPRITVTWNVNRITSVPNTLVVSSTVAELRDGAGLIANVGGSLSQSVTTTGAVPQTTRFTETITLTPAQASRIARASVGSVTITRLFTDTQSTGTGVLRVSPGAGNTGDLQLRRIELAFENDSRTDVVRRGERQRAIADVSFRSSGLLKGEWRIVDPSSSYGSARYRVLQVVRQQLVSSGQGRTRIVSPALPTNKVGLYLVTFVADDDSDTLEFPVLRYFVLEGQSGAAEENLDVFTPAEGAQVSKGTVFSWENVPGAQAYQVEIFAKGSESLLSGKLVPSSELSLSLSVFSLAHLTNGKAYDWRLRAIGSGGKIIGVSPKRTLYIP